MLDLRDKVKSSVWKVFGDGKSTNIQHDQWSNIGALNNIVTRRNVYNSRLKNNMNVSDMVIDNRWNWPEDWLELFPIFNSIPAPNLDNHAQDKTKWKDSSGNLVDFSTKQAWEKLNQQNDVVE